jgi:diguanylate cyclase (GGDEF)-like protein
VSTTSVSQVPSVPSAETTLATLTRAVQELSLARRLEDVQRIVRRAARQLTDADGATFVLREGRQCVYADEDAISPLWKGQRFPLSACISGWSMLNRRAVAIEDIYQDSRIPPEAYRPTFVKSLVMVPIRALQPLGAIGMYWAEPHRANEQEIGAARALADSTAVALEHVLVLDKLDRTVTLSETDPLTGLPNRRAWDAALGAAAPDVTGTNPACVAMIDLDDFKVYNDTHGHQAGDALLKSAAAAWRGLLRPPDVIARYGGEEFALLLPACPSDTALRIAQRLRLAVPAGQTASIGIARWDASEDGMNVLMRADAALYEAKASGRNRVVLAT